MIEKPSDIVEIVDNIADINNAMIEVTNQRIQTEIDWLQVNYNDAEALRMYFISLYNTGDMALYYHYANQLNSCLVCKLQEMAKLRANILYTQIYKNDMNKCSAPLKAISEILKILGK